MKRARLLKSCFFLFILISSFLPLQSQEDPFERRAISSSRHWLDIDYVGDRHIAHRLDIHLPRQKKRQYPAIICIYGSAWFSNNSKANIFSSGIGQVLLEHGFAVVSINHRSSRDAIFPAQIHDVKAAIRFVRANADAFSIDNTFIGITGSSSGGHLSAFAGTSSNSSSFELHGVTIDIEGKLGNFVHTSSHVDAVVDWFGPTDFLMMDDCGSSFSHDDAKSPESSLVGGPIQEHQEECKLADPTSYIRKDNPPFLIFHGDADPLVPHCQSEKLYQKLQASGVESEYHLIAGGGHGPGVMIDEYYRMMVNFLTKHSK